MVDRFEILYEDNHLLVVDKPPGLPTQPDTKGGRSLLEEARADLKARHARPGNVFLGMVHRLDRPASGVVVFARTSKAAGRLSLEFRERRVQKTYWAVVEGAVQPAAGRLEDLLVREGDRTEVRGASAEGGWEAALTYRVLALARGMTLLEIELETGRKHQIRAQFAARGHPIVGDARYGSRIRTRPGAILLHSRRIAFEHPTKREQVRFEAPLPEGWPLAP